MSVDWEQIAVALAQGAEGPKRPFGQTGNTFNPSVPNYDAYSRLPVRAPAPGTQTGGYSGIPVTYQGWNAPSLGALKTSFWNDPTTQRVVMAAASAYYGYPVKNMSYGAGLIEDAVQAASSNPNGPTPWELITGFLNGTNPATSSGGGGSYGGGGGGGSSTTSQIQLTNPDQAKQLINTAMASLLGRRATGEEYKKFLTTLNEAERSSPIVTTVEGDTVTVTGGTSSAQIAEDYVTSRPDYAEYQAATTFMDAFISALDDPVSI